MHDMFFERNQGMPMRRWSEYHESTCHDVRVGIRETHVKGKQLTVKTYLVGSRESVKHVFLGPCRQCLRNKLASGD